MKKSACTCALSLLLAIPFAGQSLAQNNMEKLQDFRQTGTELEMESVPQDAQRIETIRKNLERIQLPPGFKIDLYAIVPDARHMAVGTNVGVVFVGTRKTKVWAVTDRDKDRMADEVKQFAPSMKFKFPNGPVMSKEGVLYIAEHNRILAFPAAEFFYEGPDIAVAVVKDQFIPAEEEYFNHAFRVLDIGPDGKLYVALGQPYNVFPADKMPMEPLGSIARLNQDGTGWEVYAHGIRNSVGLDFHPVTGELWFNDNQVDGMGDDVPSGELNRAPSPGLNFGFPWYGGGSTRTVEYKDAEPPEGLVFPEIEWQAHAADLGMTFYTGNQFPSSYRNDLFTAQHGSWNRTSPVGAQIMHVDSDEDGNVVSSEVFAKGWLDEETGEYLGRPVDVKQYLDGSLLVSDDLVGAIYRISYDGESQ